MLTDSHRNNTQQWKRFKFSRIISISSWYINLNNSTQCEQISPTGLWQFRNIFIIHYMQRCRHHVHSCDHERICCTLTLQSLVLLLHAQQQDLLVDSGLPEGPVVSRRPLRPLLGGGVTWHGQQASQRIQTWVRGTRRERQQLSGIGVVWKTTSKEGSILWSHIFINKSTVLKTGIFLQLCRQQIWITSLFKRTKMTCVSLCPFNPFIASHIYACNQRICPPRRTTPLPLHLWIIQCIHCAFCVKLWGGLCYHTCLLHGCRWLVHGWRHPQEDLLSPGDPARGQRQNSSTQRVAAAAGQRPLPALPIATREESHINDTGRQAGVVLHQHSFCSFL